MKRCNLVVVEFGVTIWSCDRTDGHDAEANEHSDGRHYHQDPVSGDLWVLTRSRLKPALVKYGPRPWDVPPASTGACLDCLPLPREYKNNEGLTL